MKFFLERQASGITINKRIEIESEGYSVILTDTLHFFASIFHIYF